MAAVAPSFNKYPLSTVRAHCPIRQCCPIRHNIACLGNMNLSNCTEFDNLTLNFSVGTKLSRVGYFPFAHLLDSIF